MKLLNYFLLLFMFCFCCLSLQAQECGTPVTPEVVDYMKKTRVARQSIDRSSFSMVDYDVPIKIHIVRRDDGTGGTSESDIMNDISNANTLYAPNNMTFYQCGEINYIDDTGIFDYSIPFPNPNPDPVEVAMSNDNNVENVINIYFVINSATSWAYFPGSDHDRIIMNDAHVGNGGVLAHELGHYFSLFHTFEPATGLENVTRNSSDACHNCETAGDELCDTQADPGMVCGGTVNNLCNYSGTIDDACGVQYTPETDNVMSYSCINCLTSFSPGQYDRILFSYLNERDLNGTNCDEDCILTSVFHFENEDAEEQDEFCEGDLIFLNGAASEGEDQYQIGAWRRPIGPGAFEWQANIGWTTGQVTTINLNDAFNTVGYTFEAGFEYQIKLATSNDCNNWVETLHVFTLLNLPTSVFHFENESEEEQTEFCDGDLVFLNGTASEFETEYKIGFWKRPIGPSNSFVWQAATGWSAGPVETINLTNEFADLGFSFLPGFEYRIHLATRNDCTGWVVTQHIFSVINGPTSVFHFENENEDEQDEFCPGEEIFLNGSDSEGEIQFYIDAWRRPIDPPGNFDWQATIDWTSGEITTVNLTDLFNDVGYTFEAGFEYQIKLATSNNCVNWVETLHEFIVHEGPIVGLSIPNHCDDQTLTAAPFVVGGTHPLTYLWAHGPTDVSVTVDESANLTSNVLYTYSVTVTDDNGCSAVATDDFIVFALPVVTVSTTNPDCQTGLGQICFSFLDNVHRKAIEFNIGGGYLPQVNDNSGMICYNVEPGTYDLETRWGNNHCPTPLGQVTIDPITSGCTSADSSLPDSLVFDEDLCLVLIESDHVDVITGTDCAPVSFTYTLQYDGITYDVTNNATYTQNGNTLTFEATNLGLAIPPCSIDSNDVIEIYTITMTFADGSICAVNGSNTLCSQTPNLPCNMCETLCEDPECCDIEGDAILKVKSCSSVSVCVNGFDQCEDVLYNIFYVVQGDFNSESPAKSIETSTEPCKTFNNLDPCRSYQFYAQVSIPGCDPSYVNIQCSDCNEEGIFTFPEGCCQPEPFSGQPDLFKLSNKIKASVSPNPFTSEFELFITSDQDSDFDFILYDLNGNQVKTLNGQLVSGENSLSIESLNELASGIYIYQIKTKDDVLTGRVIKH